MDAINWVDVPENGNDRIVYTNNEMHIPGLRMFGHHHTQKAIAALRPHYHDNCIEMTYVSKGSLHFWVDKKSYNISGGDLLVVAPNVVHDTEERPMSIHSMYWFQLDVRDPEGFFYLRGDAADKLICSLLGLKAGVIKLSEKKAHQLLSDAFICLGSSMQSQRDMGAMELLYFLHYVISCDQSVRFVLQPDIGKAAAYVLDHLDEDVSIEQLAREACLSVPRFKEKFKAQMGLPPREYINSQKVRAAEALLQEGRAVTEVAMALAFSSSNYFAVVFRRHTGMTPSEYQRRSRLIRPV